MIAWHVQIDQVPRVQDGPPAGLLSPAERARFDTLRTPKRRRDWLLGRSVAKRLLQTYMLDIIGMVVPLDELEIATAPDGAPEPNPTSRIQNPKSEIGSRASLSISHSAGRALCALVDGPGLAVGCDIEQVEPRAPGFARDYFTAAELAVLDGRRAADRDALVTIIWSAKEAALKALRLGLSVDTRAVTCIPAERHDSGHGWAPVTITADHALLGRRPPALRGWWRLYEGFAYTLALAGSAGAADDCFPAPAAEGTD